MMVAAHSVVEHSAIGEQTLHTLVDVLLAVPAMEAR